MVGGAGNDTLSGGKEHDVFLYSGGNDVITDYEKKDIISLSSAYENFSVNSGKGRDNLRGGEGDDVFIYSKGDGVDVIDNYDAGDTFNINGETHTFNGKSLE